MLRRLRVRSTVDADLGSPGCMLGLHSELESLGGYGDVRVRAGPQHPLTNPRMGRSTGIPD